MPESITLSTLWLFQGMAPDDVRYPKLSDVTLAFLEASCRRQGVDDWRMYDVVALMRQQKERSRQARLPKPPKRSHHVLDPHHFADEEWGLDQTEVASSTASSANGELPCPSGSTLASELSTTLPSHCRRSVSNVSTELRRFDT